jgi:predicted small metal-binding protein
VQILRRRGRRDAELFPQQAAQPLEPVPGLAVRLELNEAPAGPGRRCKLGSADFQGRPRLRLDCAHVERFGPQAVERQAKIDPTHGPYNERGRLRDEREAMAKQITCERGYAVRGTSEDEVVRGIRDHMRADHPALLEQVTDDDLRGWTEEV